MDNSVFISYRRDNWCLARLVRDYLIAQNCDAFLDMKNIVSGEFDAQIFTQIIARPYFLLILTPDSLKRCSEPGDWLLREIECAIYMKRTIIPVMASGFNFKSKRIKALLIGWLPKIAGYQGIELNHETFDWEMRRLCELLKPIEVSHETALRAEEFMSLFGFNLKTAEDYFNRAISRKLQMNDVDGALLDLSAAIRLDPTYALAYAHRGGIYHQKGDGKAASEDYDMAIKLDPDQATFYYHRGNVRIYNHDVNGAIADYSQAIRISPQYSDAYYERAKAHIYYNDVEGAIADMNEAIDRSPDPNAEFYFYRGYLYAATDRIPQAIEDLDRCLKFVPGHAAALHFRGRIANLP